MIDLIFWLALGYLGVAIIFYVVLCETVLDLNTEDEASHAQVATMWPLLFVVGLLNMLFPRRGPPPPPPST